MSIKQSYHLSFWACLLFFITSLFVGLNAGKWKNQSILNWDIAGYHLYLPACFIYQDISDYSFYQQIDDHYKPSGDVKFYGIDRHPITNKRVNKYTCGVSYFEAPLFFAAHTFALFNEKYAADGFSAPYQLAVLLSSICWVLLGLIYLRKFLINQGYSDKSIAASIILFALGTNLYSYTAYQPGMGHPFSFFLYCSILYHTAKLFITQEKKHFIALGLSIGLATLIRPVDAFVILIPLCWNGKRSLQVIGQLIKNEWENILLMLLAAIIIWLPQFTYWKYTSGSYLFYSYGQEGFNFSKPEIINGLFSYRKGWFVYTPLALFAILSIFYGLYKKKFTAYQFSILSFFGISFYVIFSWHQWFYGGSFGCRVLINSLPLLAIPLCILFDRIERSGNLTKGVLLGCFLFFIGLNLFQSWQYNRAIIHWDSMNKEYYWRVFLKTNATEQDKELL